MIPYLLLLATGIFIFGESLKQWLQSFTKTADPQPPKLLYLVIAQLVIAIYGGFFGAGAGILMLAALTFFGFEGMNNINIATGAYAPGLYIIQVQLNDSRITRKFSKL